MQKNYVIQMLFKLLFGFLFSNFLLDALSLIRFLFRLNDQHCENTSTYERLQLIVVDYWNQTKFQIIVFFLFFFAHLLLFCTDGISLQYWKSLLSCFLFTLVAQMFRRTRSPWQADDVEVSRYLENDKCNVGSALACAYVYNYLKIVLKDAALVNKIKDYEFKQSGVTLEAFSDSTPIPEVRVDCKKLLILIPASGGEKHELLSDADDWVKFKSSLQAEDKDKDGKSRRSYTNSLYQLTRKVDERDIYFAGEFATPVSTLMDMRVAGVLAPEQVKDQVRHFYSALQDLLHKQVEISGTCIPIYYDDSHPGALSEVVLRTVVKDMYRPRQY